MFKPNLMIDNDDDGGGGDDSNDSVEIIFGS
jgi:hypothetical protein